MGVYWRMISFSLIRSSYSNTIMPPKLEWHLTVPSADFGILALTYFFKNNWVGSRSESELHVHIWFNDTNLSVKSFQKVDTKYMRWAPSLRLALKRFHDNTSEHSKMFYFHILSSKVREIFKEVIVEPQDLQKSSYELWSHFRNRSIEIKVLFIFKEVKDL